LASVSSRKEIRDALAMRLGADAPIDFLMQNLKRNEERFDWRLNLMATALCMRDLCDFPPQLKYQRYAGPALFAAGADSDYVRAQSRADILRLFPGARMAQIPEAGHWVHADQPAALLQALQPWLAGVLALAAI
ncbi:MAG TPA: alpha/beta hydrolase, partial [Burkholderiaceae bacterium]|nr:alpha/beta hydrolase [Burkholderiaceae bacterium]